MRVMVDTNVLFSAILFPNGTTAKAFAHCISKYDLVISSYVVEELKRVVAKKFPDKVDVIDSFLRKLSFELVHTPSSVPQNIFHIRDPKDYPILYTAIIENVDVIISGDEDLHDTDITHPDIVTPAEFLADY